MPDPEPKEDFSAELLILEDMGVDGEKLQRINSKAAADKLIEYYKNKTAEPETEPPATPKINLKPNVGLENLPAPDEINEVLKLNLADKLNPCSVRRAANNRYKTNSRLCVIFTDDHPEGVDFESLDGGPTRLFFLLVAPEDSVGHHLKALARVSRLLKDPEFRSRLLAASDRAELFRLIREEDEKL